MLALFSRVRLLGNSQMSIGVNVSVNGCFSVLALQRYTEPLNHHVYLYLDIHTNSTLSH